MREAFNLRQSKRVLAWLMTLVMVLGAMTSVFAFAPIDDNYDDGLVAGFTSFDASEELITPVQASQYYRNLNLTPGGNVTEMRFTWHSQSTVGSIRIYEAGGTTPIRTNGSWTTQVLTTRSDDTSWFPGITSDYTVHQVIITGLAPQTDFEYVIVGENFESARKSFRTGGDDTFRFLVGGDPQIGVGVQPHGDDLSGWLNTMEVAVAQVPDAEFFLAVGDQIHTNNNNHPRSQFMYDILFAPTEFHNLPLIPVVGNHEAGANNSNGILWHSHYNTLNPVGAGSILGNTRRHGAQPIQFDYYVRWGNMLLIAMDSNTRTWGGARLEWFEGVIDANQDAEWTVVTFHHPPYSVFRATTDGAKTQIINNWIPEFQRLGVDVVLNGHCHSYSRSHQMLNNVPQLDQQWINQQGQLQPGTDVTNAVMDPTGIVFVALNSASGSGYYGVTAMAGRHYIAAYNQNFQRNFTVVDVTPNTFTISTYQVNDDSSTVLVDVYSIVRSDANGQLPAGLNLPHMGDRQLGTFVRVSGPNVLQNLPLHTTLDTIIDLMPTHLQVETDIRVNEGGNPIAVRNPNGPYGRLVRPLWGQVSWDMASIYPAFDPTLTVQQVYTIQGQLTPPDGVGSVTPPVAVYIEVIVGFPPAREFDGYISYFGARYRFYGRSHTDFFSGAFDPAVFATWVGGGLDPLGAATPIGFGSPRSLAEVGAEHFSGPLATLIPTGADAHQRGTLGANGNPGLHTFTYFSRTFELPANFDVANLGQVRGAHHLDDNVIIFINGIEIYRINTHNQNATNIVIGHPVNWNAYVGHNTDARFRSFHIDYDFSGRNTGYMRQNTTGANMFDAASRTNLELALQPGVNVLTAVVGQNSASSSDLWFDLELYLEILTPTTVYPVLGFRIFNNGNSDNESLAQAGLIRMWTQLDGVNALVPYDELIVTTTFPNGDCAMEFVRINNMWANPGNVNLIDVQKTQDWQTLYFTATLFDTTVYVTLINDTYVPQVFGVRYFNNGNSDNPSLALLGVIRIWMQINGVGTLVPFADLDVAAVLPNGQDAMEFVRINQIWNNPDYVNLIDVDKEGDWQYIYMTLTLHNASATLEVQTLNILLINDLYVLQGADAPVLGQPVADMPGGDEVAGDDKVSAVKPEDADYNYDIEEPADAERN